MVRGLIILLEPTGDWRKCNQPLVVTKSSGCYAELANSLGAKGIKIKTATALDEAITTAIELNAIGTTVLIEVETLVEERRSSLKTNFKP